MPNAAPEPRAQNSPIFASQSKRVLLIDLDPQAFATDCYELYDMAKRKGRTSVELPCGNAGVGGLAFPIQTDNLSAIPPTIEVGMQNRSSCKAADDKSHCGDCDHPTHRLSSRD